MTYQQETAALIEYISRAELRRDAWRSAGDTERYMEAYTLVMSLQLQLQRHLAADEDIDATAPAAGLH